jgi:hypothetical protein
MYRARNEPFSSLKILRSPEYVDCKIVIENITAMEKLSFSMTVVLAVLAHRIRTAFLVWVSLVPFVDAAGYPEHSPESRRNQFFVDYPF